MNISIVGAKEFNEDFLELKGSYPSLPGDLERVKKVLRIRPDDFPGAARVSFQEVKVAAEYRAYKIKRFLCKSLNTGSANSGIRVTYRYEPLRAEILLIEIYRKRRASDECNLGRLKKYCERHEV